MRNEQRLPSQHLLSGEKLTNSHQAENQKIISIASLENPVVRIDNDKIEKETETEKEIIEVHTVEAKFEDQYETEDETEETEPLEPNADKAQEEQEPFIQYSLYKGYEKEFEQFKDEMHRAIWSGPYAETGSIRIIKGFPDPFCMLRNEDDSFRAVFADEPFEIFSLTASERFQNSEDTDPDWVPPDQLDDLQSDYLREMDGPFGSGSGGNLRRKSSFYAGEQRQDTRRQKPLSYQQAVWDEEADSYNQNQDPPSTVYDQEVGRFKPETNRFFESHYSESLQCDRSEVGSVLGSKGPLELLEPFPSSMYHSAFEKGLLNPHYKPRSERTTNENKDEKLKELNLKGHKKKQYLKVQDIPDDSLAFSNPYGEEEEPKKWFFQRILPNLMKKYSDAIGDEEELGLLKQSMTFSSFIQTIFLLFLFGILLTGVMAQVWTGYLIAFSIYLHWLTMRTYGKWFREFSNYLTKRGEKRKRLHNGPGKPSHLYHPPDPVLGELNSFQQPKERIKPLNGLSLSKPVGQAGWSPRVKRILESDPVRISEVEVNISVSDKRPYLKITLPDGVEKDALFDTGSTSCGIHPDVLAELEKTVSIPREKKTFDLKGVIPDASAEITEIAYITIRLESGHEIKHVPFLVYKSNFDLLIGSNLVRSQRWSNFWKHDDYYVDLGMDRKPVKAFFKSAASLKAVSIADIQLMPRETKMVALRVPALEGLKGTDFHTKSLLIDSVHSDEEKETLGIEVLHGTTRYSRNKLVALVQNKSDSPLKFGEPIEMARIEVQGKLDKEVDLTETIKLKTIFDNIPRIDPNADYGDVLEMDKGFFQVFIQFADKFGLTATTNNMVNSQTDRGEVLPLSQLDPGIHIKKNFEGDFGNPDSESDKIAFTVLLVPDESGDYGFISDEDILDAKRELELNFLKHGIEQPKFYLMDPLLRMSMRSMDLSNRLWKQLKFSFMPFKVRKIRPLEAQFSKQNFPPEILTGTSITKLHIQTGDSPPPLELRMKDKGTPLFKTKVMGATLMMFKLGILLICHLHLPVGAKGEVMCDNTRDRVLYTIFNEFRLLRVPTEFHISIDEVPFSSDSEFSTRVYMGKMRKTAKKIKPFCTPNERCGFPTQNFEEEMVDISDHNCHCLYCLKRHNLSLSSTEPLPKLVDLFQGDINDLVGAVRGQEKASSLKNMTYPSVSTAGSSRSSVLSRQEESTKAAHKAVLASFAAIEDDEEDMPLDPLGLTEDEDIDQYFGTHPGFENDDDPSALDPDPAQKPVTSDRNIVRNPPIGIPDSFVPGEWRDHFDISKVDVTEPVREQLAEILDEFRNLLSCNATDCRPILVDGEPAIVDIKLTTDKPIFIKPYPMASRMVEVLDAKITEMLDRDEIVEVDSPYNIPVLLTHHNSENKHVAFESRKWRMCLDLRSINAHMVHKNRNSHLVKGVEFLYPRLQGMMFVTKIDMRKAYRSLIASWFLRYACAFRVPSSQKFPWNTFAFRSTPDGLANLPGEYSLFVQKAMSARSRKCTIQHIDDLLIYSKDAETHLEDIRSVFTDLLKCNFLISIGKLEPFQKEVTFLGHRINGQQIWIPEDRKSYFDSLKPPTTKKELQSLLGVAGYMAHFVDSYQLRTGPLFDALRGKTDKQAFVLNEIQMKSFEELKLAIKLAEKLHLVDFSKPIFMETDSSLIGTGSVLYQEYDDPSRPGGKGRLIIRYGSRRFSLTESLHHTSLEKEAMGILIGCKTHYYYLYNCPEAIIKTDLKSLITILSCYNNPDSARMARISHRIYSLPFKWSLQHIAGVDLPVADALSRLYPPYRVAFADRHLRYPDLKRENIVMPEDWIKTSNLILKNSDILDVMHHQVCFVEKSSSAVKNKRLRSMVAEIAVQYEMLQGQSDSLVEQIHSELEEIEATAKKINKHTGKTITVSNPLTAVSPRVMITPQFLVKHQNENQRLNGIITQLRTIPQNKLKPVILDKYRLLNDSILVTRKNRKLPFDAPGNIRIVCDTKMTLIILSLLHVMGGHYGINTLARLFSQTYKSNHALQGYAKMVALGCRACRFHRPVNRKTVPPGRVPLPPFPYHTFQMDHMVFKKDLYWKGKKIEAALNIVDLYSNLLISFLVPDQKATTTIKCLKELFSKMPAPFKMVSDNGPALCAHREVLAFLKSKGVQTVTTITPYNSRGNKTERIHKTLRETLALVKETFQRKSQFDMYFSVIEMLNNRPLSLVLYPHIKKALGGKTETVTPFSLHYGFKPPVHPLIPMEDQLAPDDRESYQKKWQSIISNHDKLLQDELNERNKNFKENEEIQPGELVLLENKTAHKENLKYYRNLYEVVSIKKARYYCAPLFGGSPLVGVNGNLLKPYKYTELFELLPAEIRHLMGESLSPDHLKQMKTNDPKEVPKDFQDWGLLKIPEPMKLRNRLSPASLASVPAISLSNTNTLSHISSDSGSESGSGLSLDEEIKTTDASIPPHRPRVYTEFKTVGNRPTLSITSIENPDESVISEINPENTGAPQLVATETGIVAIPTKAVLVQRNPKPVSHPARRPVFQYRKPGTRSWDEVLRELEQRRQNRKTELDRRSLQSKARSLNQPKPVHMKKTKTYSTTSLPVATLSDVLSQDEQPALIDLEAEQVIDQNLPVGHQEEDLIDIDPEPNQPAEAVQQEPADPGLAEQQQTLPAQSRTKIEELNQNLQQAVEEALAHSTPKREVGLPVRTRIGRISRPPARYLDFDMNNPKQKEKVHSKQLSPSSFYSETPVPKPQTEQPREVRPGLNKGLMDRLKEMDKNKIVFGNSPLLVKAPITEMPKANEEVLPKSILKTPEKSAKPTTFEQHQVDNKTPEPMDFSIYKTPVIETGWRGLNETVDNSNDEDAGDEFFMTADNSGIETQHADDSRDILDKSMEIGRLFKTPEKRVILVVPNSSLKKQQTQAQPQPQFQAQRPLLRQPVFIAPPHRPVLQAQVPLAPMRQPPPLQRQPQPQAAPMRQPPPLLRHNPPIIRQLQPAQNQVQLPPPPLLQQARPVLPPPLQLQPRPVVPQPGTVANQQYVTRYGRHVVAPSYLKDYVVNVPPVQQPQFRMPVNQPRDVVVDMDVAPAPAPVHAPEQRQQAYRQPLHDSTIEMDLDQTNNPVQDSSQTDHEMSQNPEIDHHSNISMENEPELNPDVEMSGHEHLDQQQQPDEEMILDLDADRTQEFNESDLDIINQSFNSQNEMEQNSPEKQQTVEPASPPPERWPRTKAVKRIEPPSPGLPSMSRNRDAHLTLTPKRQDRRLTPLTRSEEDLYLMQYDSDEQTILPALNLETTKSLPSPSKHEWPGPPLRALTEGCIPPQPSNKLPEAQQKQRQPQPQTSTPLRGAVGADIPQATPILPVQQRTPAKETKPKTTTNEQPEVLRRSTRVTKKPDFFGL